MNVNKKKIAAIVVLLSTLVFLGCGVYEYTMDRYDVYIDEETNPNRTGAVSPYYHGGTWEFWVNKEFPRSEIVMIVNSTSRAFSRTSGLHSDSLFPMAGIGGCTYWLAEKVKWGPDIWERNEYYIEWWVLNATKVYDNWYTIGVNGSVVQAWHYEFYEMKYLDTKLPITDFEEAGFTVWEKEFNLTLYGRWRGYI